MRSVRVMLVDDQQGIRDRLRQLIDAEADMGVVGEAGDGESAVATLCNVRRRSRHHGHNDAAHSCERLRPMSGETTFAEFLISWRTCEAERRELEERIAVSAACCEIEIYCRCSPEKLGRWYDTTACSPDEDWVYECVAKSVRYLELCGLIERNPTCPGWVRMKREALL